MKKVISVLVALILVLSFSVTAFAETVKIDEFKLSFDFPENWYIATKDTPEDSDIYEYYLYYDVVMEYFANGGCFAMGVEEDGMSDISLYLEQTDEYTSIKDLNFVALEQTKKTVEETYSSYGYDDLVIDTYEGAIETFITISYTDNSNGYPLYCLDYVGLVDGVHIELCFFSYDVPPTEKDIATINGIVDSIVSENVVPSDSSSSSSVSGRRVIKGAKAIISLIVAGVTGLAAWIKKKFGKNKAAEAVSAPVNFEANENPENPDVMQETESFENTDYGETSGTYVFPNTEDSPTEKYSFCPSCGAQLADDDKFCPLCGSKVK